MINLERKAVEKMNVELLKLKPFVFQYLLNDPSPSVRCVAVVGVFRAMRDYWELLSEDLLKNLTKTMVNDMRFDSASKGVRESVIRVCCFALPFFLTPFVITLKLKDFETLF